MSNPKLIQGAVSLSPFRTVIGRICHKGNVILRLEHRPERDQATLNDRNIFRVNTGKLVSAVSDTQDILDKIVHIFGAELRL